MHTSADVPNRRQQGMSTMTTVRAAAGLSTRRRMGAASAAALMALSLTGCNKQTSSCDFKSGEYGVCTIDTTGSADSVELPFYVDPEKSGSEFADHYDFEKAEGGVATFVAGDIEQSCRQGETVQVGQAQADCIEVGEDRLKVRLYVGTPPEQ